MSEFAYQAIRAIKMGDLDDLCTISTPREYDEDLSWFCTRDADHEDPLHVAHNVAGLPMAAWNDTEKEEY